jgi:hypothetical protein
MVPSFDEEGWSARHRIGAYHRPRHRGSSLSATVPPALLVNSYSAPGSCPSPWCNCGGLSPRSPAWPDWSASHAWQADDGIIAQRRDGFQGHVAAALGRACAARAAAGRRRRAAGPWRAGRRPGRKAAPMKAETMARPLLPACLMTFLMKWTRQRCQVQVMALETEALMPSWASETTSLTPRRPRRARPLRKSVQKTSVSEGPTARPTRRPGSCLQSRSLATAPCGGRAAPLPPPSYATSRDTTGTTTNRTCSRLEEAAGPDDAELVDLSASARGGHRLTGNVATLTQILQGWNQPGFSVCSGDTG